MTYGTTTPVRQLNLNDPALPGSVELICTLGDGSIQRGSIVRVEHVFETGTDIPVIRADFGGDELGRIFAPDGILPDPIAAYYL